MNKIEIINERMNSGMLINLTGNETVKKPYDYPNDFDEYIQWICDDFFDKPNHAIYTDKLYEYDSDKYKKCSIKIWGNDELDFDNRTPIEIEKFLSLYFNKDIELISVNKTSNIESGNPVWVFYYRLKTNNKKNIDDKMYNTLFDLDHNRQKENHIFRRYL